MKIWILLCGTLLFFLSSLYSYSYGNKSDIPCSGEVKYEASFDRPAAAHRLAERFRELNNWDERQQELWKNVRTKEDADAAREVLGERPHDFDDFREDALKVVEADASDDAAFDAIQIILWTTVPSTEFDPLDPDNQVVKCHSKMERFLLEYHLHRPEVLSALYSVIGINNIARIERFKQAYKLSFNHTVRGNAAFVIVSDLTREIADQKVPEMNHKILRSKIEEYIKVIERDYNNIRPTEFLLETAFPPPLRVMKNKGDSITLFDLTQATARFLSSSVGATLPNIKAATLDGRTDDLRRYRGKVVMLDFWATWCQPCIQSHSTLAAFKSEMQGYPFEIIGISIDKDVDDVIRYLKRHKSTPWVHWHLGPDADVRDELYVFGVPTYFVLDKNGVVKARSTNAGFLDESTKEYIRTLVSDSDS